MAKHKGRKKIPTIYESGFAIREVRPNYWLVDFQIEGRRIRKAYSDIDQAKLFCQARRLEITNKGIRSLDINDTLRTAALEAERILKPTGASIVDAAKEYLKRHPVTVDETFRDTCDRYIVEMGKQNRRPLSIADKAGKLKLICAALGDRPSAGIDKLDIQAWVDAQGYANGTARAYLGAAKSILAFYRGESRQRHTTDEKPPVTWGPEVVTRVMQVAESDAPDIVPALAILFFAGIRPDEVKRLTWESIDLEGCEILLDGSITKTRTMRHVAIEENLRDWLLAYRGRGAVAPTAGRFRRLRELVTETAGLDGWPVDVARHTYATMLYKTTGDGARVMQALGHFGNAEMFVRHYKGTPVSKSDANSYWNIKPGCAAQVVQFNTKAG